MPKVCALVITHNRLDKLKNCLAALAGQEYVPAVVLVVDNASTDGTQSFLAQTADWPFLLVHERGGLCPWPRPLFATGLRGCLAYG